MSKSPPTPLWKYPLRLVRKAFQAAGYELVKQENQDPMPTDADEDMRSIIAHVRPYSMASNHRLASMLDAVRYVCRNKIEGSIVECGVWRGANMIVAALGLKVEDETDRKLFLYDTFEGMSPPAAEDRDHAGVSAEHHLSKEAKGTGIWCHASIEDVKNNMANTGYPTEHIHYVKGMVENTIPQTLPGKIALLRLDTDWYESTKHEMEHFYPLLQPGGVLLIDDYGHWQGARQAVDESFARIGVSPLLSRIDYTCRCYVKPA